MLTRKGRKTSQKVEQKTSQVDNKARVIKDEVIDYAVELVKVKIDSEILANSLLKLQEKAVLTHMKVKESKKVKLAANFQCFDPRKAAEALAKSNEIKKAKAKETSKLKLITAKRTAKQRDDDNTLKDSETQKIKIVGRPSLPNASR